MDELSLADKLRRVEALFLGAKTEGEAEAAAQAMSRIRALLDAAAKTDPPVEQKFLLQNEWSRQLFSALLRRYGIEPYRYRGQRYTTVMAKVSKSFVDETLWPEFLELDAALMRHLDEVTHRAIAEALYAGKTDVSEREENPRIAATA